jgi:hypothetical protein
LEIKLDLRSQNTQYAALERATIDRRPDFVIHTLTYSLVFPGNVYSDLYYKRGKIHNFGEQGLEGRLVDKREMSTAGVFVDQFIKQLRS